MGSVQMPIECPNCKSDECVEDSYYKTGEFYINCPACGYHHSQSYLTDKEGAYILRNKDLAIEPNNWEIQEAKVDKPFGSFNLTFDNGCGQLGTLADEEEYEHFLEWVKEHDMANDPNVESVIVKRFVNNEFVELKIIDNEKD